MPAIALSKQPGNDSFFFIADLHSMTSIKDATIRVENTRAVAAAWLAFGFEKLGLDEIISFAVWNNARSTAVMERLGMRRDPSRDFNSPKVPNTHPALKRHVVYALTRQDWTRRKAT